MFRDAVKEDMQGLSVTEEDARDWLRWRQIIYLYVVFFSKMKWAIFTILGVKIISFISRHKYLGIVLLFSVHKNMSRKELNF